MTGTWEMIKWGERLANCSPADVSQIALVAPLLVTGIHDEVLKESKIPFNAGDFNEVNKVIKKRLLMLHKVLFRP